MEVEEVEARLQSPALVVEPITDFAELNAAVLVLRRRLPILVHLCVMEHALHNVVFKVVCQGSAFVAPYVVFDETGQRLPSFEHQPQVHLGHLIWAFGQDVAPHHVAFVYVLNELVSGVV